MTWPEEMVKNRTLGWSTSRSQPRPQDLGMMASRSPKTTCTCPPRSAMWVHDRRMPSRVGQNARWVIQVLATKVRMAWSSVW